MASHTSPLIEAHNLSKQFGDVVAINDVSFSVARGEVFGLLGPNGAGKTTAVKMLTTLTTFDRGSALIAGHDVSADPDAVRRVIGLAGQSAAVDEKLTARENLELFARLYKLPRVQRRQRIDNLIDRFDMSAFADRVVSTFSGGQRRRLDIVAALVAEPLALFLDEPTTGLDPRSRSEVWESIRNLASAGTAIVLTTQYLDEADHLADEIMIIDQGRTVATGSPQELKREVGRDVLEVQVISHADLIAARTLLESDGSVVFKTDGLKLAVSITAGASQSLGVLRLIEDSGVTISDFQLRRPTLDDVFLAITSSHTAQQPKVSS